ncbi:MAG: HAMP domain-containing sensor histidine kinase [Duganella sp.]
MASERGRQLGVAASVAALLALAVAADALALDPDPRRIVLCALLGMLPAAMLWQCVQGLARPQPRMEPPSTPAVTEPALRGMLSDPALAATAQALDARLEHAPIALFRIEHASGDGIAAPLNVRARRLLAPGRASAPHDLHRLLAAQPVGQRQLVSFDTERGVERALVAVSTLAVHGAAQRLAAVMPVESELEAEALNAWRQLVQVLTHEIMNSLTPVASLSRTACGLLDDVAGALPDDVHADLETALDAIARRAASLVEFVASYRSLSTVPPAQPQHVALDGLFARLAALVAPQWQERGGSVTFSVAPASLTAVIDPGQLEQALINLLKNAAEAQAGSPAPQAQVTARLSRGGRLRIEVADQGPGVPPALAAHIFTPFFSTKKQGRGIGLAMVRHLAHANGGTVRHVRQVGAGARFLLTF